MHQIMTKGPMFYARPGEGIEKCQALMAQNLRAPLAGRPTTAGSLAFCPSVTFLEQIIAEEEHVIRDLETERLGMTTDTGSY